MDRCAFCGVEVGHWVDGDDAFQNHQPWSSSYVFVKGLFVGNIPAPAETSQQQPSSSYDVCGPYMEYTQKPRVQSVVSIYLLLLIYFLLCIIFGSTLIFIVFCSYKFQTTMHYGGMALCIRIIHHTTPECSHFLHGLLCPIKTLTI